MINCMKMIVPILLLYLEHSMAGKIFTLNETEYKKMPELYELDYYPDCLLEPGGLFCMVDLLLSSNDNSSLMEMIEGYSEVTWKHYNHTQLHRGLCITQTCKEYIGQRNLNNTEDVKTILEECVNTTIWKDYSIQARVVDVKTCHRQGEKATFDVSDYVYIVIFLAIIGLNSAGTFYDFMRSDDTKKSNPYLMSFSVLRNWKKLVATSGEGPEPRLSRLKLFNGMRTLTIICVILSHATLVMTFSYTKNPLYLETTYDDIAKQIMFNGSSLVCTFFVMSAFLLAFNYELHAEKHGVSWSELPKGIILRWIRLTPSYFFILGMIATIGRHIGEGPLWDEIVLAEARGCRQYWWSHLLYINNYIYDDYACMPQTWYLAADMQLFILGLIFCIAVRTPKARKITLGVMMVLSLLTPALHTYFQDLDASIIDSPEILHAVFKDYDTFRYVYIPGHTNMASYVLGIAGALMVYQWLTEGRTTDEFKKYRYLVWLSVPVGILVMMTGAFFYGNERAPLLVRAIYAALFKPVFQCIIVFLIACWVFKAENVYRRIMEWSGFTVAGRVSYGAFLIHTILQRDLAGQFMTIRYVFDYYLFTVFAASTCMAFMLAAVLWLCVEAPVKEVLKAVMTPKRRHQSHQTQPPKPSFENTKV